MTRKHRFDVLRIVSLSLLAPGLALVGFMVRTESEPGALPLALVLVGAAGTATALLRSRRNG